MLIHSKHEELEKYPGVLPGIILMEIDANKYFAFLEKKGLFEKYYKQLNKTRRLSFSELIVEFKNWIGDNPQYKDFIVE